MNGVRVAGRVGRNQRPAGWNAGDDDRHPEAAARHAGPSESEFDQRWLERFPILSGDALRANQAGAADHDDFHN
jgi:hypothetical protein